MSSIRLSKKHGLNPTLGVCFFCGEDTGELALLGALKGDAEAPKRMILNYTPCDKCKEHMSQGITLIETNYTDGERPAISKDSTGVDVYPTGRWCVIKQEAAERIFSGFDFSKRRTVCLEDMIYSRIVDYREEGEDNDNA